MRLLKMLLTSSLLLLSLSNCAQTNALLKIAPPPPIVDTFCTEYIPVIQQPGDAAGLTAANDRVKRSILSNEKVYRTCP